MPYCCEISLAPLPGWRLFPLGTACKCPALGEEVSLSTPPGRPPAVGGPYCPKHGGRARALAEARRDWMFAAPACVGDEEAVLEAGHRYLDSTHAYVTIGQDSVSWLAWLGIGSHLLSVPSGALDTSQRRRLRRGGNPTPRRRGRAGPACAFASQEEALAAATALWRLRLGREVDAIRAARGGTLDWGEPVLALDGPIVLDTTAGDPWRQAAEYARTTTTPLGTWRLSGRRPTGEVL